MSGAFFGCEQQRLPNLDRGVHQLLERLRNQTGG